MSSSPLAAVTGARGLIGRYIVQALVATGWQVRVLSRKATDIETCTGVSVVVADINNEMALRELCDGVSAIFHCAAELHNEPRMHAVNVKGTESLLRVAAMSSCQYFCHLSSAGVIGPVSHVDVNESTHCSPFGIYEKTKYEAEKMVVNAKLDMNVCILRPANVFDAHKPGLAALPLHDTLKDRLLLFFRGNEGAHLIHAKDVADAAVFFLDKVLPVPEIFLVSYDDDDRNSVAGMFCLSQSLLRGCKGRRFFSLPNDIPYLIRNIRQGRSLHGRVRFSGKKLCDSGFVFSLGLEKSLKDVCDFHKAVNL